MTIFADVANNVIEVNSKTKNYGIDIKSIAKYLLPIGFTGDVGAVCMGNQTLKYMPILSYKKFEGDLLFFPVRNFDSVSN